MSYCIRIAYIDPLPHEAHLQYTEVGDDLHAVRSVEVHRDGRMGFTDEAHPLGPHESMLPEGEWPAADAFPILPECEWSIIERSEFERVWAAAVRTDAERQ